MRIDFNCTKSTNTNSCIQTHLFLHFHKFIPRYFSLLHIVNNNYYTEFKRSQTNTYCLSS